MEEKILIIGGQGQIGVELVEALQKQYGENNVISADIKEKKPGFNGIYETINVLDKKRLLEIVEKHQITTIYHLAALLSATAEKNPDLGWDLNMNGLFNVLDLAKKGHVKKIFWPSSIAVFGPDTPKENTPQFTIMNPNTVYGISKLAGERWCEYYHKKYGVDVRSVRYPGLIGYKSLPGGGTTDYAVDIFYKAKKEKKYDCFLSENTYLPMMYMEDAIRATIEIMQTPAENIKIRSSYNLAGISFSPKVLFEKIKVQIPEFQITYNPDFRQAIADSWPKSIDDSSAKKDWNWLQRFDIEDLVNTMLKNIHF